MDGDIKFIATSIVDLPLMSRRYVCLPEMRRDYLLLQLLALVAQTFWWPLTKWLHPLEAVVAALAHPLEAVVAALGHLLLKQGVVVEAVAVGRHFGPHS